MWAKSSALQERVKRPEAFKAAAQDFFIRQSLFRPSFENAIDSDAFGPLKFFVFQVGVVNHFADFADRSVSDRETIDQRFELAIVADMRVLAIHHVARYGLRN